MKTQRFVGLSLRRPSMKTQRLMCVCHRKWQGCMRSEKMSVCALHYTSQALQWGQEDTAFDVCVCGIGNGEVAGEVRK